MHESFICRSSVITFVLWAAVGLALLVAWVIVLLVPDHRPVGAMLAASACALSALAAAAQIRHHMLGICSLIRATAGLDREPEAIHSIR